MAGKTRLLTIGETAARCGVATSALRFYESRGLIQATRATGNQRRYHRAELRKIALIKIAQNLGLSLSEIEQALSTLPDQRTPTKKDWEILSRSWRARLDTRITELTALRDNLSGCIGCGCLSLKVCALYNREDCAAREGCGARYLLGNEAAG